MNRIPTDTKERLDYITSLAWEIFLKKVSSKRISINKEASMQLHYSVILEKVGEILCIKPKEEFRIQLESKHERKNIDVVCSLNDVKAAIEMKCFMRGSNRAIDIDMYDVLKDISRLLSYRDFQIRKFFCLTDNPCYSKGRHSGHAGSVTIKEGTKYHKDVVIKPSWTGRWKDKSRDFDIRFSKDVSFNWADIDGLFYLIMDL